MKPIGYNAKLVERPEPWLGNPAVEEILSVSECISRSPIDHVARGRCNTRQLYDTLADLEEALAGTTFDAGRAPRRFYYEAHSMLLLDGEWLEMQDVHDKVQAPPDRFELRGYDVVCFSAGSAPECSPLSCNAGAQHFEVDRHCLLPSLEAAIDVAIRIDAEGSYEPGPYAVVAVWELVTDRTPLADWP